MKLLYVKFACVCVVSELLYVKFVCEVSVRLLYVKLLYVKFKMWGTSSKSGLILNRHCVTRRQIKECVKKNQAGTHPCFALHTYIYIYIHIYIYLY